MDDHSHEVAAVATVDTTNQVPIAPVLFWIGWLAPLVPLIAWRVISGRAISTDAGGVFILWVAWMVPAALVTAGAAIAVATDKEDAGLRVAIATFLEIAVAAMVAIAIFDKDPLRGAMLIEP